MHLSSADKKAAQDGFKFLVLSPSGARKCYCTTVKEAKAEAGKGGKIVSLGRMRYTTQNPSARMVGLQRNPTVAVWDEPVVIGFKNGQKLFREKVPFPHPMYSSVKDMVADLYGGNPNIDEIKVLLNGKQYSYSLYKHGVGRAVASKTKAKKNPSARMVGLQRNPSWMVTGLLAGGAYVYGRSAKVREKIKGAIERAHKKLENPTARMVGLQRNPRTQPADPHAVTELVLYIENDEYLVNRRLPEFAKAIARKIKSRKYDATKAIKLLEYLTKEAATKYDKEFGTRYSHTFSPATRRAAAAELLPSAVVMAEEMLMDGTALYARNPTAHMVGMQRNPSQRTPLQRFYLVDHDSMLLVGKFSRRESARKKANNLVARDPELRGMKLASEHDLSILRQGQKVW